MGIVARDISKSFDQGKSYALQGVNVSIDQGEFIAVIGLSGAGKSTFLRCINGMNPLTAGSLQVLDKELNGLRGKDLIDLRRQIGFVFQQFNLVKNLSALQNVLVGRIGYTPTWRTICGMYRSEDIELAKETLNSVGLSGRHDEKIRNLSGGQQQRVAIARALVQNPKIILADEPMASLDPKLSEVVLDMLAKANSERGITVIVNIHVLELARKYARRALAFRRGKLVYDGPMEKLDPAMVEEIYALDGQSRVH